MHSLDLIQRRWLDYEPPSNCHDFGIGELLGLGAAGAAEAGAGAAAAAVPAGLEGFTAAEASALLGESTAAAAGGGLSLSSLGPIASVGGTLLSAKSAIDNANYQKSVANVEAQALKQKANEDAAAAERRQITQQRQTDLALSRARALSAASGGTASDPGEVNLEGRIAQEGDYNALSSLYEGLAASRADRYQADIDLFKGRTAQQAAPMAAFGTILSGLSSFATNRAMLRAYAKTGSLPYGGGAF